MATEVPPTKADEGVDDSPIVVNSERRDSLDKKLQLRPDETDLKNRHILLDNTAAPALQARAAELERQRITDNLKKVPYIWTSCSQQSLLLGTVTCMHRGHRFADSGISHRACHTVQKRKYWCRETSCSSLLRLRAFKASRESCKSTCEQTVWRNICSTVLTRMLFSRRAF